MPLSSFAANKTKSHYYCYEISRSQVITLEIFIKIIAYFTNTFIVTEISNLKRSKAGFLGGRRSQMYDTMTMIRFDIIIRAYLQESLLCPNKSE